MPDLKYANGNNGEEAEKAASSVFAFGKERREKRLSEDYFDARVLSARAYNAILIGTVLWGLLLSTALVTLFGSAFSAMNPLVLIIIYFVVAIGGILISAGSKNPGISFLGFNMVAAAFSMIISTAVTQYLEQDASVVLNAFLYTMLISVGMLGASLVFPQFFAKIGGMLLGVLTGLVLCELILLIFGVRQNATDWVAAGLFSLYIGYDTYRSQQFTKTADNAVDCAVDIYMDIANLFIRLLRILAKAKSND